MLSKSPISPWIFLLVAALLGYFPLFTTKPVLALETPAAPREGQSAVSQKADSSTLYQEGLESFKKGDYEKALMKFRQVRMRDPDHAAAQAFLKRIDEQLAFQERQAALKQKSLDAIKRRTQQEEEQKKRKMDQRLIQEKKRQDSQSRRQEARVRSLAVREEQRRQASLQKEQKLLKLQEKRAQQEARREEIAMKKDMDRLTALHKREQQSPAPQSSAAPLAAEIKTMANVNERYDVPRQSIQEAKTSTDRVAAPEDVQRAARTDRYQKEREQRKIMKQAQTAYREAVASYKINHHLHARDQMEELRVLLSSEILPDDFRQHMTRKADLAQQQIEKGEARLLDQRQKEFSLNTPASLRESSGSPDLTAQAAAFARQVRTAKKVALASQDPVASPQITAASLPESRSAASDLRRERSPIIPSASAVTDAAAATMAQQEREDLVRQKEALKQQFLSGVDELYQDGVQFYEKGVWDMARDVLFEVERMVPDYKMTKHYLSVIENKLEPAQEMASPSPEPSLSPAQRRSLIEKSLDDLSPRP